MFIPSDSPVGEEAFSDADLIAMAYQQAFNVENEHVKTAYFYRKDITDQMSEDILAMHIDYLAAFSHRFTEIFIAHGKNPAIKILQDFFEQEMKFIRERLLIKPMQGMIKNIIENIAQSVKKHTGEISSEIIIKNIKDLIGEYHDRITSEATILSYEKYFRESYDNLVTQGVLYILPNGEHKWSYNASWLQGHFNKGTNIIVIKTPIDESSKTRGKTSDRQGDFGSGFYREIATCYIFGYRIKASPDGQIIMLHENISNLKSVQLEGILKYSDSLESLKSMETYYNRAIKQYQKTVNYLDHQRAEGALPSTLALSSTFSSVTKQLAAQAAQTSAPTTSTSPKPIVHSSSKSMDDVHEQVHHSSTPPASTDQKVHSEKHQHPHQ